MNFKILLIIIINISEPTGIIHPQLLSKTYTTLESCHAAAKAIRLELIEKDPNVVIGAFCKKMDKLEI